MKRTLLFAALSAASIFAVQVASATTFTYHGVLQDAGKPAQGKYDIELTLYSSQNGGSVVGGPMTLYAVPVQGGSFSTDADFGPLANSLSQAFVAVKVRPAGAGNFTALAERSSVVETNASCPGSWSLNGNAGNPAGSYLGTADSKPLILKVNGSQAASFTPNQGVALSQTPLGAIATGRDSFATGIGVEASGSGSFAAGAAVFVAQTGSFMWGDNHLSAFTATNGPNQFVVRAGGGVAINGVPKNSETELTIYPSATGIYPYSNMFMGNTGKTGGMLVSVGDETTATSNDAKLYIDQFDGTRQARKFTVRSNGVVINDPALIPASSPDVSTSALSIVPAAGGGRSQIDMYSYDSNNPTLLNYWSLLSGGKYFYLLGNTQQPGGSVISNTVLQFIGPDTAADAVAAEIYANTFINGQLYVVGGDLTVSSGNAYKVGGGVWMNYSDRRIKKDVAPITSALETLMQLRPVSFHYTPEYLATIKKPVDKTYLGFIAQDFATVFPEAVVSTDQSVPGAPEDAPKVLAIDSNPAIITTVAAVQELSVKNADLEDQVKRQGALIADQQKRLDALAARMNQLQQKAH